MLAIPRRFAIGNGGYRTRPSLCGSLAPRAAGLSGQKSGRCGLGCVFFLLVEGDVTDPQVRVPYEFTVVDEGQEPAVDIQGLTPLIFANGSASIGPLSLNPGQSASYGFHLADEQVVRS